jgi:DNA polymerase III subunit delta'
MSFDDIQGQPAAIQTLTRALSGGRIHHAYRFQGPPGVGKELTALRFAQALMCEKGGLGCGACSACRRAITFTEEEPRVPLHPDVVLVGRGVYRSVTGQGEATGIGVEQVRRVVLGRVGFGPHEGRALVFIVREAETLTPSAANSLLKTLEEPPPRTHFVLLTSRANRLLDTIRSRTLPVRFGPLSDAILTQILSARGLGAEAVVHAEGSAELALLLAAEDSSRAREDFVKGAAAALAAPDFADAVRFAESRKGDREVVRSELAFYAQTLAGQARERVARAPHEAERLAERHHMVMLAMDDIDRNVQPALVLETLFARLRGATA